MSTSMFERRSRRGGDQHDRRDEERGQRVRLVDSGRDEGEADQDGQGAGEVRPEVKGVRLERGAPVVGEVRHGTSVRLTSTEIAIPMTRNMYQDASTGRSADRPGGRSPRRR